MRVRTSLIAGLAALASTQGCSPATEVTKSAWVASPDGRWLTRTVRYDTAGPGIDSLYETVELKRRTASQVVEVFTLDEGSLDGAQLSGPPIIWRHWIDPHHLEIKFRAGKAIHHYAKVGDVFVRLGS